jgi:DNA-binding response OmpR family regulator
MSIPGRDVAVLVVSHDPNLRDTYIMLFQQTGYTAQAAEPDQAPGRLKAIAFSAMVLDHTLSMEERQSLVHMARRLAPETKIVAFHASAKDSGADLAMDSREGARVILERVAALLNGALSINPGSLSRPPRAAAAPTQVPRMPSN